VCAESCLTELIENWRRTKLPRPGGASRKGRSTAAHYSLEGPITDPQTSFNVFWIRLRRPFHFRPLIASMLRQATIHGRESTAEEKGHAPSRRAIAEALLADRYRKLKTKVIGQLHILRHLLRFFC